MDDVSRDAKSPATLHRDAAELSLSGLSLKNWGSAAAAREDDHAERSDGSGTNYEEEEEEDFDEASEEDWGRVEDADWELARGDFTKMFNRSRQLAQVIGQENNTASTSSYQTAAVPLPAMNKTRTQRVTKVTPDVPNKVKILPLENDKEGKGLDQKQIEVQDRATTSRNDQLAARLQMQNAYDPSATAGGALSGHVPRKGNSGTGEKRVRDKSDRSTVQQVLDPRTLAILFKMLQKGLLKKVNGVISTGKEANVYHASTYKYLTTGEMIAKSNTADMDDQEEGIPLALKIYKTTILVFKDRDRYITGEFRFRHGYSKHNPRKMVKLWAEKEARNLKRLVACGIRCPRPIELRDHVLVMEYLEDGTNTGRNSPRLKDAEDLIDARYEAGEDGIWLDLYVEMLVAMRTIFHQCRLVHADLSEYNVLYHREHLYIIDVSQSVEQDHPYAFDFLRADITHIDDYFAKKGNVKTLGLRKTFEWIVRPPNRSTEQVETESSVEIKHDSQNLTKDAVSDDRQLNSLQTLASGPFSKVEQITRPSGESDRELTKEVLLLIKEHSLNGKVTHKDEMTEEDQAVFRQAYIPQTLNEVFDPERDIQRRNEGKGNDLIYANVIGMEKGPNGNENTNEIDSGDNSISSSASGSESDEDENPPENGDVKQKTPRGHRHEDRDAKKERKKEAKEAARERRKTKMPKAEKKKRMRNSHK